MYELSKRNTICWWNLKTVPTCKTLISYTLVRLWRSLFQVPPAAVHSTLDTAIPNLSIVDAPYKPAQRPLF